MTAQKDNGENINFTIPKKVWLYVLAIAFGSSFIGGGSVVNILGGDAVSKKDYEFDRKLDSISDYRWHKEVRQGLDSALDILKEIKQDKK